MNKDLVFITSAGRTGTQFFGDFLKTAIEDCWSAHEPDMLRGSISDQAEKIRKFGFWYMVPGRLLGTTGVRPLGQRLLTNDISKKNCFDRLRRSRSRYHKRIAQSLIIESNYQWWPFAKVIGEIWPGAKMIGIIRDPRHWVRSWQNHGPRHKWNDWTKLFPPGRLTPSALGDQQWYRRWKGLGTLGKLAWEWRTIYTHLDSAVTENPSNIRMFRFEDLFGQPEKNMQELIDFAANHPERKYRYHQPPGFAGWIRNASKGLHPHWLDWRHEDARLVEEMCGSLMQKYGYGLEDVWGKKVNSGSKNA